MSRKKTKNTRGEVVYGIDYQPSKAELEDPIRAPKDLMEMPMPEKAGRGG